MRSDQVFMHAGQVAVEIKHEVVLRAAHMPSSIDAPLPRNVLVITRAPASWASSGVPSIEPSSTTRNSPAPGGCVRGVVPGGRPCRPRCGPERRRTPRLPRGLRRLRRGRSLFDREVQRSPRGGWLRMVVELFRLRKADVREGDVSQSGRHARAPRSVQKSQQRSASSWLKRQKLLNIADRHGVLGFTVGGEGRRLVGSCTPPDPALGRIITPPFCDGQKPSRMSGDGQQRCAGLDIPDQFMVRRLCHGRINSRVTWS